jgi:hypothetical protein
VEKGSLIWLGGIGLSPNDKYSSKSHEFKAKIKKTENIDSSHVKKYFRPKAF